MYAGAFKTDVIVFICRVIMSKLLIKQIVLWMTSVQ